MNFWLYNDSWNDFKKTLNYIGFASGQGRAHISQGDRIVYASGGIVAGIFTAVDFMQSEFQGWAEKRPFQVVLTPFLIPSEELIAKPLRYKSELETPMQGSQRLYKLSEQEFGKIEAAIREKKREMVY